MTSFGSSTGGWSRDDSAAFSWEGGAARGRRLYRSDSLPAGGSEEAARARDRVSRVAVIPRTAMAHFNADGTPKSILKKTSSVGNDTLLQR